MVASHHVEIHVVLLLWLARPAALPVLRDRLPLAGKRTFGVEIVEDDRLIRFDAVDNPYESHGIKDRYVVSGAGHQTNEVVGIGRLECEGAVTHANPWTVVRLRSLVNQVTRHGSLGRVEGNVNVAAILAPIGILDVEGEAHDSAVLGPTLQVSH